VEGGRGCVVVGYIKEVKVIGALFHVVLFLLNGPLLTTRTPETRVWLASRQMNDVFGRNNANFRLSALKVLLMNHRSLIVVIAPILLNLPILASLLIHTSFLVSCSGADNYFTAMRLECKFLYDFQTRYQMRL